MCNSAMRLRDRSRSEGIRPYFSEQGLLPTIFSQSGRIIYEDEINDYFISGEKDDRFSRIEIDENLNMYRFSSFDNVYGIKNYVKLIAYKTVDLPEILPSKHTRRDLNTDDPFTLLSPVTAVNQKGSKVSFMFTSNGSAYADIQFNKRSLIYIHDPQNGSCGAFICFESVEESKVNGHIVYRATGHLHTTTDCQQFTAYQPGLATVRFLRECTPVHRTKNEMNTPEANGQSEQTLDLEIPAALQPLDVVFFGVGEGISAIVIEVNRERVKLRVPKMPKELPSIPKNTPFVIVLRRGT
jgi:hypothetical protein